MCRTAIRRGTSHPQKQQVNLCALSLLCRMDAMEGNRGSRLVSTMVPSVWQPASAYTFQSHVMKLMGAAHKSSVSCLQLQESVARVVTTQSSPFQLICHCPCCRCTQRVHVMSHARCAMKRWRQGQRCWRCPASTATMRGASPPG